MLKHTYIFGSYLSGLLVHSHGKMTPHAYSGLMAGGLAMSSGQVEVGGGLTENVRPTKYMDENDIVNHK